MSARWNPLYPSGSDDGAALLLALFDLTLQSSHRWGHLALQGFKVQTFSPLFLYLKIEKSIATRFFFTKKRFRVVLENRKSAKLQKETRNHNKRTWLFLAWPCISPKISGCFFPNISCLVIRFQFLFGIRFWQRRRKSHRKFETEFELTESMRQ